MDHQTLSDTLLPTVHAAGRAIMAHYGQSIDIGLKPDSSPVTAADCDAEAIILRDLAEFAPNVPVIAEEAVSAGNIPHTDACFFLVDPLDGTKEFIQNRDEFTVNIALIENTTPIFGIIYAPATAEVYWTSAPGIAIAGELDWASEAFEIVEVRTIATRPPPSDGLTVMTSRSHLNEATMAFLETMTVAATTNAGSSLKFCHLASGQADLYPRLAPTMEWDTGAGHAILTAAGGTVVTTDGLPLIYGKREKGFLNPSFIAWGQHPDKL